jgi:hypothetical protein
MIVGLIASVSINTAGNPWPVVINMAIFRAGRRDRRSPH